MRINFPNWQSHPWLFRQLRKMSIPLTWLLLKTPLRPNEISLIAISCGVLAAILFAIGYWYTGVAIMFLAILLDFSDGEVSRYRGIRSKEGSYLDKIYIFCVHPALIAGMTIGVFSIERNIWIIVAGFVNTISIFLLCMVIEYAKQIVIWKHCQRFLDKLQADPTVLRNQAKFSSFNCGECDENGLSQAVDPEQDEIRQGRFSMTVKSLLSGWDFPWIFCIMAAVIVAQKLIWPQNEQGMYKPMVFFLYFYAITYPPLILIFLIKNVYKKTIEVQYKNIERQIITIFQSADCK
jgi:hypothetical protein